MYTISEAAELLGLSTHTLRYYEKEKIIETDRTAGGDRIYTENQLAWLRFVVKLKQTQMPLAQIREYTNLFLEGEHTANARLKLLENHRKSIHHQVKTLEATEKMLDDKITAYKESINKNKIINKQ
ncbi:MerR family transcriptional regulator [Peribacillus frigoritolerans]|uniref:MerR family transcriptional regulator n=1 Tax=Peribacillus frigoritolerans TaxID=450367 RepID=UPI001059F436|nr:MerR family transcriptional regulator [Peribacillus frigoritolerans]TDL82808.1 MerR family transcriptional regulator [Peribacillus frigoritolerans]